MFVTYEKLNLLYEMAKRNRKKNYVFSNKKFGRIGSKFHQIYVATFVIMRLDNKGRRGHIYSFRLSITIR